ncbi:hypothetical protein [Yoonia sp. SS1-5]|uniref:DUF7282 domain-containing protein n=1 Tax=Yoonia rhodophyticola TaxID=3137370 RepID=A0AAN0MBC9_9RHOB
MKTTAIVAALGMGSAAVAEANFGLQATVEDDSTITLDLVRTSESGILAIYDYSKGEFGDLIGTASLDAGVNTDVKVSLDPNGAQDVAAVIYEGELTTPSEASNWIELEVSEDS